MINKKRITELLLKDFPNANIFKFSSRKNDYDGFSLRTGVSISYSDLDNYYNSLEVKEKHD